MSDKAAENAKPNSEEGESEGGLLPAILAGAGILAVVALLVFGPSSSDDDVDPEVVENGGAAAGAQGRGGAAGRGGVQAREVDDPARRTRGGAKLNPQIKLPPMGMAPEIPAPQPDPPPDASTEEKIDWYERKLDEAIRMRESRKKFAERLPKMRERIEQSDNPEEQLAAFESRKKQVEENYAKARARVEELETKLAELRGM